MEEKRINTIVTEESIVESLHKQLDNNEFSMLEKALKAFGQSKSNVSDIDILLDCTSGQGVNYCELTEKFSKLTIPIKQEVGVVYHLEGTYSLTAELNPVPKEIFMSFYK